MPKVTIRKSSYNYEELRIQLFEILDEYSGTSFGKGSRVVIKPNLLSPAAPEYVLSKGAKPCISDSPAMGAFELNTVILDSM